ncbi:glycosyltransferase, partial [candidate division KSB1 bacterium]|nr:glycosyltransferase [candidate division KSB1 bacterium]NIT70093.1 glycosyltransferase [candidate division KSB1 bacterium]NIU23729.1 glycosyltransferase [candidate division KSB1 bacterium]NIU93578.1 glycosyltransferase [candidate division KSB1 bacterium]NIW68173.1 glycosyltransferase [candidate division KSB1 bacterium]
LEIEKYNATNYQSSEVRKELGIKAESAVIGIVGRFTPKKGHREFFHAAKQIKDEAKTKVRFLIVGGASHG